MKKLIKLTLIASLLSLTACATVFSGTTKNITVRAVDSNGEIVSGSTCTVIDGRGFKYDVIGNPGTVNVSKSSGGLSIECSKPGYKQGQVASGSSFNALTVVNVLFWPGFIVDVASGAMNDYPSHISVNMEKLGK